MTAIQDIKTTLENRLELLDYACEQERPGTAAFDELCGRHEESKTMLELVNYFATTREDVEDEAPAYCDCDECACEYDEDDLDISLTIDGSEVVSLDEFQEIRAYNYELAIRTLVQQEAKLSTYWALKELGLPIPYDLRNECWPLDPDNPDNQPRGTSWQP
jgi:hypothetical protein